MKQSITMIVLAGGIGKRFAPFTTNKALFPFFGIPMISLVTERLPREVSRLIIVTNPENNDAIRALQFSIPASTVIQNEPAGMANALLACKDVVTGPLLVVGGDDIIDMSLLSKVCTTRTFGAVPGWKPAAHGPFGYLVLEGNRVTGIVEKPEKGKEPSEYIAIVCHYISDAAIFFETLAATKSTADDVYEKALTNCMARNEFSFIPYDGAFAPLKYPWHVLDVTQTLLSRVVRHKGKNVVIKKNVVIEGAVFIDDNVKIYENTKIVGPCYIGKNTVIGNNCIIRQSHIGRDSVIGFNCDITRSYLGANCWLHMNYVGDSVLEEDVSLGGGAKLANLRLDDGDIRGTGRNKLGALIGKGVRIGVNASVMPGIQIGSHSFIGSGVIVDRDIPKESFCIMEPNLIIKKNTHRAVATRAEFRKKI